MMTKLIITVLCCIAISACAPFSITDMTKTRMNSVVQIVNFPKDAPPPSPDAALLGATPPSVTPPGETPPQQPVPPSDQNQPQTDPPKDNQKDNPDDKQGKVASGTGFIIGDNIIVTNNHVIDGTDRVLKVIGHNDNKMYDAHVIATDAASDIAILKIDEWDDFKATFHPVMLHWADSMNISEGEIVWSIGHPYGLSWTVAQGIISSTLRHFEDDGKYYMQTTTAIYPGNSGGPLFDLNGDVVGINSAMMGREGYFGLTIPSDYAEKIIDNLMNGGKVKLARIGVILDASKDMHHIIIKSIDSSSNSIAAGLLPNDQLFAIRSNASHKKWIYIHINDDIIYQVSMLNPGETVDLDIIRDNVHKIITFAANEKVIP
jgi:S1-C subfamily serine protease